MKTKLKTTPEQRKQLRERYGSELVPFCPHCREPMQPHRPKTETQWRCHGHRRYTYTTNDPDVIAAVNHIDVLTAILDRERQYATTLRSALETIGEWAASFDKTTGHPILGLHSFIDEALSNALNKAKQLAANKMDQTAHDASPDRSSTYNSSIDLGDDKHPKTTEELVMEYGVQLYLRGMQATGSSDTVSVRTALAAQHNLRATTILHEIRRRLIHAEQAKDDTMSDVQHPSGRLRPAMAKLYR